MTAYRHIILMLAGVLLLVPLLKAEGSDTLLQNRRDSLWTKWDQQLSQLFFKEGRKVEMAADSILLLHDSLVLSSLDDSLLALKFDSLNAESPIDLRYNEDVGRIVKFYLTKRKSLTSRVLGRMDYYFSIYEPMLDKYNLPLELKYLSIIESALSQQARSWAGASGLWQFMSGTARMYDLDVGVYVDERYDMYKATEAACQHFRDLYNQYGDWLLVLAAYNAGSGNVNRAIRRSGGQTDFWQIRPFLPRETRAYVPSFIAVNYVFQFAGNHYIYPSLETLAWESADTVTIKNELNFDQIAEFLDVDNDILEMLNPGFRRKIIPANDNQYYTINIPGSKIDRFLMYEDSLYVYKTQAQREMEQMLAEKYGPVTEGIHVVKRGQSLGVVASKYGCDVEDLKDWNKLQSTMLHPGQKLVVYAPENVLNGRIAPNGQNSIAVPQQQKDYIYHTVQKGDTLSEIAERYPQTSVRQLKDLNNIYNERKLRLGQKIKIAPSAG
ncbi:MAG: LysM peptidoglycan-binding domain-containing protein [Bacteroidota bacterium]